MDVETFFNRIRRALINLIRRKLNSLNSARVQTTTWIRFIREDEEGQEKVELAFNSLMMNVYRGSNLFKIVNEMIANMKFQIENPALLNSRFVFDEVLHLNANFYQLNLTRGSSYLPLPDWLLKKKYSTVQYCSSKRRTMSSRSQVEPLPDQLSELSS